MIVLGFQHHAEQGKNLASMLGCGYDEVATHHFPDGESRLTLPLISTEEISEVIVYRTLDHPNDKLVELYMVCASLREQGIRKVTLVAPYLCYMRQDKAFNPGEVVAQRVIGQWLGEMVDKLITVDPHLHRIRHLDEVVPNTQNIVLSAAPLIADFLSQSAINPLLLGPDEESQQWVSQIAERAGLDWAVAKKIRHSDHSVSVELPRQAVTDRHVVIIDDVASTGHTLADAARLLRQAGAREVSCFVTHALLSGDAEQVLAEAAITHLWSSDSIAHQSNVVSLTPLLADTLRRPPAHAT